MKKLYRANSSTVGGVCKGLSKYFIVDESLIRIIFFALIFTPFPIIITYLFMWMIIPLEEHENI
jgi:phage shock protein PspC (stress-responsive transcriptional regulator)